MRGKTTPIDEYLARVGDEQRAALERLRRTIRAVAPGAEEIISCGIPTFRLETRRGPRPTWTRWWTTGTSS